MLTLVIVLLVWIVVIVSIDPLVQKRLGVTKENMKKEGVDTRQIRARAWIRYVGFGLMIFIVTILAWQDQSMYALFLLPILFLMYVGYAYVDYRYARHTNRYKKYIYDSITILLLSAYVVYLLFQSFALQ